MSPPQLAAASTQPKVGARLAYGDFDRDGDLDLLMTTNHGPAYLYRNDVSSPAIAAFALRLIGTKSNRDAIGAIVRISTAAERSRAWSSGGSSYLSQSELPVTFGLGQRDRADRLTIDWPSGKSEEYKNLAAGKFYECTESQGIKSVV